MAEGIQERHLKDCATRKGSPRCNCRRSYRAAFYNAKTKKRSYSGWSTDKSAAAKWRNEKIEDGQLGVHTPGEVPTIGEAWAEWIKDAETEEIGTGRGRYKASTLSGYRRIWKKLEPEFGARKLTDLTHNELQAFIKRQTGTRSTKAGLLDPLRVVYKRALKRGQALINPTTGIELPPPPDPPDRRVTAAEAAALIDALPEYERALWATAMYAGLRRSELRALRCEDIDFAAGVLKVERAWPLEEEHPTTPKTKASKRKVGIAPPLAEHLRAHLEKTGRTGSDLIFGRDGSTPFLAPTLEEHAKKAWKVAGLQRIGLHEARHAAASFMIAAGYNDKQLMDALGHASVVISIDRYGHLMPGGEAEAARLLGEYLAA